MASITENPQTLGLVTVVSAGTPVNVLTNHPEFQNDPAGHANKIHIVSLGANAGNLYLGYQGMDKVTLEGVIFVLQPGEAYSITHPTGGNRYAVGDYWVDADTDGDKFYGSYDQQ